MRRWRWLRGEGRGSQVPRRERTAAVKRAVHMVSWHGVHGGGGHPPSFILGHTHSVLRPDYWGAVRLPGVARRRTQPANRRRCI